jgi:ADP-ribose pyrophosphatase
MIWLRVFRYFSFVSSSLLGGGMAEQFKWLETTIEYREIRKSNHGDELRWLINRETILNTETGQTVTRSAMRHPGICVMIPFVDSEHILLMHQYRYAVNETLWELPAGTLEGREENARMIPIETPEACAARELLEETGYEAEKLEKVCECYATPGSCDELMHIFSATGLTKREQSLDLGEVIYEVRPFSLNEIREMIEGGKIRDAKTLVGLFMILNQRREVV